ncbi:hypothetical protein PybrP1_000665 [[Pythium] brassicae (nom. inval.)]|nr:hypothetical protein PybrP1_000665 [[Pythium] brassicae (nom. inval.)]
MLFTGGDPGSLLTAPRPRVAERVKVFCRLRPLLQREKDGWSYEEYVQHFGDDAIGAESRPESSSRSSSGNGEQLATFVTDKGELNVSNSARSGIALAEDGRTVRYTPPASQSSVSSSSSSSSEAKEFVFDTSLSENADQEHVYAVVAREVRGIIPRALEEIFHSAEQSKAQIKTSVALSYVQIYCERVFDLLAPETPPASIVIREDPERGVYLDGAACSSVASASECLQLLARGNANRAVAATGMNAHSSRSHAVLILRVERKELLSAPGPAAPHQTVKISSLYLVDLAGAHCNVLSVLDYKGLYEDAQQRLDAAGERERGLASEASAHQLRAAHLEDQLLKAHMRIQHLEFENQAGNAALEATCTPGAPVAATGVADPSAPTVAAATDPPGLPRQLAELVAKHDGGVRAAKAKCDLQVATYQKLADQAAQEWHEAEDALETEKRQVLSALQELKEFKLRFFELEDDTTDRIAELVQDARDKERELRESADSAATRIDALTQEIKALKQQLADAERERKCLQDKMDTDFVPRDTDRVGTLETKAAAAATGASQRKVVVVSPPPANNQAPERANIGGPQSSKAGSKAGAARAIPKIGRLVPGSKAASAPNGLW